jgi:hypothetical protein
MLAKEFPFFYPSPQASMMNKVTTSQFSQECFLLIIAGYTFELFDFNVQFFALDDIPPCVLTKETR